MNVPTSWPNPSSLGLPATEHPPAGAEPAKRANPATETRGVSFDTKDTVAAIPRTPLRYQLAVEPEAGEEMQRKENEDLQA